MLVITTITNSYKYSAELSLSLSMFQKALPKKAQLIVLNSDEESPARLLKKAIAESLEQDSPPQYILIVKEPSVIVGNNAVLTMRNLLENNSSLDCILPSDIRGFRKGHKADYLTLKSFNFFVSELQDQNNEFIPYDAREPFMFLIRTGALKKITLPENIFSVPGIFGNRTAVSLNAYIHPFFDYYNEKREDVLPLIPETASSVLDIGCSRGGFGKAVKAELSCRVAGIEQNADEGEKAREFLDKVVIGDAMKVEINERFDCVTCLDTLEHFADPESLLKKIKDDFLVRGGHLLISIPNVGHWSIVEDLMAGHWDYLPVGILCNTHLRFFTLNSITKLLKQNGFEMVKTVPIKVPMPENTHKNMKTISETSMSIDFNSLETVSYNILASNVAS